MSVALMRGRYYVGFSRPWYISQRAVQDKLEELGFTGVVFFTREKSQVQQVDPHADPDYSDDWDEWLGADYKGAPKVIEQSKVWAWLVVLPDQPGARTPPAVPATPAPPPAPPAPAPPPPPPRIGTTPPASGTANPAFPAVATGVVGTGAGLLLLLALIALGRRRARA